MIKEITSYAQLQEEMKRIVTGIGYIGQQLVLIEKSGYTPEEYYRQREMMYAYLIQERAKLDYYRTMSENYMTVLRNYDMLRMLGQGNEIGLSQVDKKQIEEEIIILSQVLPEGLKQEIMRTRIEEEKEEVKEDVKEEVKEEEISSIEELDKKIRDEQDKLVQLHQELAKVESAVLDEAAQQERKAELHRAFGEVGENLARYINMRENYSAIKSNRERIKKLGSMTPSDEVERLEIERSISELESENKRKSENLNTALLESMELKEKVVQEDNQVEKPEEVKDIEIDNNVDKVNTEVPVDVQVEQTSEDAQTEDKPVEVQDEIQVEEQNLQLPAVVTPPIFRNQTVSTEEKPAEVSEENKLNTEVQEDVQVEQTNEEKSTEDKLVETQDENRVNTEVTEDVQVEQTNEDTQTEDKPVEVQDEVQVEEQNLQLPAVVTPPIFGNQKVSTEEKSAEVSEENKEEDNQEYLDIELAQRKEQLAEAEVRYQKSIKALQNIYNFMREYREDNLFSTVEELDKADEDYLNIMSIYNDRYIENRIEVERLKRQVAILESIQQERAKANTTGKVLVKDDDAVRSSEVQNEVQVEEQNQELPAVVTPPIFGNQTVSTEEKPAEVSEENKLNTEVTEDVQVKHSNEDAQTEDKPVEVQDEVQVEEQNLQLPSVGIKPIFGNQTVSTEEKPAEVSEENKLNTEVTEDVQVKHSSEDAQTEDKPVETQDENRVNTEVIEDVQVEQTNEDSQTEDKPAETQDENRVNTEVTEDVQVKHSNEEESIEDKPVETQDEDRANTEEQEETLVEDHEDNRDVLGAKTDSSSDEEDDDLYIFDDFMEEPEPKRSLQTIIASVIVDPETGDPVNMTVKQRKRFEKSNISITGALKNGLTYGNYLYNLTSIAPTIIGVIPNTLMKLSGKIMLTRKAKHNIKVIKENLEALPDADLEVLYREFKGDTTVNLRGAAAITGLIKEAVEKYQERKYIEPKRSEMKVLYETILNDYEQIENNKVLIHQITSGTMSEPDAQTLIQKLGVSNLNQAVALLERRNNRLMDMKSYQILSVRELGKELQNEFSSGKHGFAEDIRATDSKMNLKGRRFAKNISTGAAHEIMTYMGQLQDAEAAAIVRGDDEAALQAFIKLETTQARESKIEGSILGKRDTGLYHYNPIPEELDYRQDPFVRNLLTTVTTAAMVKGIVDQIHNRMMEADLRRINEDRANQQKIIDDVNQRNSEASAHNTEQQYAVQQGSATLTGNSESVRRGMQAQIDQDIAATRATHEYMDHDATGWSFNDAYHAADQAHHTTIQNAAQDAQNQLAQIQQNLAAGRISDVEAMRQIALVNSDTHSMFQQAVQEALPVFKDYAQAHPDMQYEQYIAALERLGSDPTAIDALNQQAINAIEVGNTLQGVNILPYEQLGIVLEEVPTGIKSQLYLLGATALMTGHAAAQAQQFSKQSDNEEILSALETVVKNDESRKERHEHIDKAQEKAARTNENEEVEVSDDDEILAGPIEDEMTYEEDHPVQQEVQVSDDDEELPEPIEEDDMVGYEEDLPEPKEITISDDDEDNIFYKYLFGDSASKNSADNDSLSEQENTRTRGR